MTKMRHETIFLLYVVPNEDRMMLTLLLQHSRHVNDAASHLTSVVSLEKFNEWEFWHHKPTNCHIGQQIIAAYSLFFPVI